MTSESPASEPHPERPGPRRCTQIGPRISGARADHPHTLWATARGRWRPRRTRPEIATPCVTSALADVVVVVEATLSGGSRITADRALDYGRPVLAVPGSRRNPAAAGCNALLADGAQPLLDPSDVLVALGLTPGARRLWEHRPGRRKGGAGQCRSGGGAQSSGRGSGPPRPTRFPHRPRPGTGRPGRRGVDLPRTGDARPWLRVADLTGPRQATGVPEFHLSELGNAGTRCRLARGLASSSPCPRWVGPAWCRRWSPGSRRRRRRRSRRRRTPASSRRPPGPGHPDDRLGQRLAAHRAEELGVTEGEDPTVGGDEPVAVAAACPVHPDDRLGQLGAPGGAVELGITEGEDPPVGGHEPVALARRRRRHATIGLDSGWPPMEPKNLASPKEKIPPSAATNQ